MIFIKKNGILLQIDYFYKNNNFFVYYMQITASDCQFISEFITPNIIGNKVIEKIPMGYSLLDIIPSIIFCVIRLYSSQWGVYLKNIIKKQLSTNLHQYALQKTQLILLFIVIIFRKDVQRMERSRFIIPGYDSYCKYILASISNDINYGDVLSLVDESETINPNNIKINNEQILNYFKTYDPALNMLLASSVAERLQLIINQPLISYKLIESNNETEDSDTDDSEIENNEIDDSDTENEENLPNEENLAEKEEKLRRQRLIRFAMGVGCGISISSFIVVLGVRFYPKTFKRLLRLPEEPKRQPTLYERFIYG